MRKLISILVFVFLITGSMTFAAPFPDLPADHWATEAVKVLAEKGMVEGYPNGTFRGQRAATRYEVAMEVARLLAYLEKRPQVSKEDLDTIKKLVDEFKDELDAMGVRLKNVEDLLASLQNRVTELERVKFSGGFASRFSTNQVSGCSSCVLTPLVFDATAVGTRLPMGAQNALWDRVNLHNPDREGPNWDVKGYPFDKSYTIFPTRSGTALTDEGYLGVKAKLSDDYSAGGVISMYNDVGQLGNGYIYGVNPTTISNPFQAGQTPQANTLFGVNLNAAVSQVYVTNDKDKMNLAVGDWRPAYTPDYILQGLPNMGVFGPDYLPFYGGQLYGQVQGGTLNGLYYEAAGGRLSVNNPGAVVNGTSTTYQNFLVAGTVGYSWKDVTPIFSNLDLSGSYVRAMNDGSTAGAGGFGGVANPGLWAASNFPLVVGGLNGGNQNQGGAFAVNGVGPQVENLYGANLKLKFGKDWKWIDAFVKYGGSDYTPSRSAFVPFVHGNLFAAGVNVASGRFSGRGQYLYVSPFYDPFVAQVPIPSSSFTGPISPVFWMGYPYSVSYGPMYTNVIATLIGQPTSTFTGTTGGAGDVFYNLHDSSEYPQNRTGFRFNGNWDYGHGNLGGSAEYLQQVKISSYPQVLTPGFSEPIFMALQNPSVASGGGTIVSPSTTSLVPTKGFTFVYSGYADYTFPSKKVTLDAVFTNSRIKRFEPDFNNVDLNLLWLRGGVTYRPNDKWSLLGGFDQFNTLNGAGYYLSPESNQVGTTIQIPEATGNVAFGSGSGTGLPRNFNILQRGPYFAADYAFVKGMDAWVEYHAYYTRDNSLRGYNGYAGTQLQSGLRFTF